MDDNYLKMIHAFDQGGEMLKHFASLLASYHKHLCAEGFQRSEALTLVQDLQAIIFENAFNQGPPNEDTDD